MSDRIEVNAVAFQQGDLWVAQCVEYDIAAFAKSLPDLPRALKRALAANLCVNADLKRTGLESIPAAPERFRLMFKTAKINIRPTEESAADFVPASHVQVRDLRVAEAA